MIDWKTIDIEIPGELLTSNDSEINFELLNDKIVVGLCGYARCGKDTIGNLMVKHLGFQRISFADTLKEKMNEYMTQQVYEDLIKRGVEIELEDIDFLNPKSVEIKELTRGYLIFFGETMKLKNGIQIFTNSALSKITNKKVVITDVRRYNELELFKNNKEHHRTKIAHMRLAKMNHESISFVEEQEPENGYQSLLIHISQLGLQDFDELTWNTIRLAQENWMFDEVIHVDPRIPDKDGLRQTYMYNHLLYLVQKFPKYFI